MEESIKSDNFDIWEHPEIFQDVNFDKIIEKVIYINKNLHLCDRTIRELNRRIDLDYINCSELIEGHDLGLGEVDLDKDIKILYRKEPITKDLLDDKLDDLYDFRNCYQCEDKPSLVIVQKFNNEYKTLVFNNSIDHLEAVNFALKRAREDKVKWISSGESPKIDYDFIENVHHKLFDYFIKLNSKINPKDGSILTPYGYGKYRETVYKNNIPYKVNVDVEGVDWKTADSDNVRAEMNELIDKYNTSKLPPILKALIFKTELIRIQPFRDGNKRTSRILFNYLLVRYGIPTITIRGNQKENYFKAVDRAISKRDFNPILKMIKKALDARCDKYIEIINNHKTKQYVNNENIK